MRNLSKPLAFVLKDSGREKAFPLKSSLKRSKLLSLHTASGKMAEKLLERSLIFSYRALLMFRFMSYSLVKNLQSIQRSKALRSCRQKYKGSSSTCFRDNRTKEGLVYVGIEKFDKQILSMIAEMSGNLRTRIEINFRLHIEIGI